MSIFKPCKKKAGFWAVVGKWASQRRPQSRGQVQTINPRPEILRAAEATPAATLKLQTLEFLFIGS